RGRAELPRAPEASPVRQRDAVIDAALHEPRRVPSAPQPPRRGMVLLTRTNPTVDAAIATLHSGPANASVDPGRWAQEKVGLDLSLLLACVDRADFRSAEWILTFGIYGPNHVRHPAVALLPRSMVEC